MGLFFYNMYNHEHLNSLSQNKNDIINEDEEEQEPE